MGKIAPKKELKEYTVALHCVDTLTRYVAYVQLVDITDADALENELVNWLDDNTNEPDPWTGDCFVIDSVFEGTHVPVNYKASDVGRETAVKAVVKNKKLNVLRDLTLGDDLYLIMGETMHGTIECYTFTKLDNGQWAVEHTITEGEYADGMDFLVEAAADHDHEWSYGKLVADPF